MIIAIVNHYIKEGMIEIALRRIHANGDTMAKTTGYLFRHLMVSNENRLKYTTVTAWENEESYGNWVSSRRSNDPGPAFAGESPYALTETEIHTVIRHDTQ